MTASHDLLPTAELASALDAAIAAAPDAATWQFIATYVAGFGWWVEPADVVLDDTTWLCRWASSTAATTSTPDRFTLPADEANRLSDALQRIQVAHVVATDSLLDGVRYLITVRRGETRLSWL